MVGSALLFLTASPIQEEVISTAELKTLKDTELFLITHRSALKHLDRWWEIWGEQ